MRAFTVILTVLVAMAADWLTPPCQAQSTLAWNPSTSPDVAGYYLCWGTSSGNYTFTNAYGSAVTSATLSSLITNEVYYLAVQCYSSNGVVSPFSSEISITNTESSTTTNGLSGSSPPFPGTNTGGGGGITNTNSQTGGNSGTNGSGTGSNSSTNVTQALMWGVPPFLTLAVSNGQPNLNIGGTVGATLAIQSTTNIFSLDDWSTVTNVAISNTFTSAETNQENGAPPDALDLAYVPGYQTVAMPPAPSGKIEFFRAVMPYDYIILADQVLPSKSCTPRLIIVNMPGIVCDDVCYVNESASFIHYSRTNYALQLEASGSTIRQIATTLANSLNLDWTSASEFSYSNGLCQILANVIETDNPSSDQVAGQVAPSPPIVIDF
jgi:hypothetical protein